MLQAAGEPLPEHVWGHGFIYLGGERFSKSAGVKLDLDEAIDRFGPDAFRYFLLREVPWDGDGSFSWERFQERYDADLANGLGNLASRALAMLEKYRGGIVPAVEPAASLETEGRRAVEAYAAAMDALDLKGGADAAWALVAAANLYIQQTAPWALAKAGREGELDAALGALAACLYRLAVLAAPFMPTKAEELWRALGMSGTAAGAEWQSLQSPPTASRTVHKPDGLFPKPSSDRELAG
jgi:methionyl-tRNA synthetase